MHASCSAQSVERVSCIGTGSSGWAGRPWPWCVDDEGGDVANESKKRAKLDDDGSGGGRFLLVIAGLLAVLVLLGLLIR